ncbi:alpha-ketoglutarate-dependent dioxygenase AlkB [Cytophagales bacterium LB-30]|uniref:Alpha-ketoglutarate-dependent dioxygenase AlkB n=1 Tax=Shiella aurantiaca TaxID=3058365 RepID=A0ABT8F1W9_9BACT|nr:alpha-ketoglutarate-dependent dioxygenase AlkB [Shiella aurantiaca]MDN4164442.1 alpha-ketoglutarate-dependent dioxygenase AlkB [Shiella aurantiaca]
MHTITEVLPYDGQARYFGPVLSPEASAHFQETLLGQIVWESDQVFIYGKHYITKRQVAWYGDKSYPYTYSKSTKRALPWTPALLSLKQQIEDLTGEVYHTCLLNLYPSGEEGMGWHSDDEKELRKNGSIASLSLGALRPFDFKHRASGHKVRILLEPGSLLEMRGTTQTHWLHALPKTKKVKGLRINLTFRQMEQG